MAMGADKSPCYQVEEELKQFTEGLRGQVSSFAFITVPGGQSL